MHRFDLIFGRNVCLALCAWVLQFALATQALGQAAAAPRAYYSDGSGGALVPASPQLTAGGSVVLGAGGAQVAAAVTTDLANPVILRLPLVGGPAPAGYRAGMLLANASGTGVAALGTLTLRTYRNGARQESRVIDAALLQANLLSSGSTPTPVDFVTALEFDAVELELANLANVNFKTNVYYAYGVTGASSVPLKGALSRFASPNTTHYSSTAYSGNPLVQVCLDSNVGNPVRAVDLDLTNFATFGSLATVACPPTLRVKLEGPAVVAGYYAGFTVGNAGLLDASLLSGLRIRTFLEGVFQETNTAASLLQLNVLPGGQTRVGFLTTKPFDAVSIERTAVASVLDNLKLYYGFGLEPRAFGGSKQVLSSFTNPANKYSNSQASLACVLCGITNPANAADSDPNNYAQFATALGIGNSQYLRLKLNADGLAGNRAGMVIGAGDGILSGGLLSANVLESLVLSTYNADGELVESARGGSLLAVALLPDGREEISFLTTKPFASVRLDVTGGVAVLSGLKVYVAFADDPQAVLPPPFSTALPVVLTEFAGRRTAAGADLAWATASERNSSLFVVERSASANGGFQAVGQVAAAGNSSAARRYQFADASAATQGTAPLYYRLRQVDLDGTTAYSPVVALAAEALARTAGLQVYPNPAPAAGAVALRYAGAPGASVFVYSELGALIRQLPLPTEAEAALALPALPAGLYHVVVRDGAGRQVAAQRLVRQ